MEGSRSIFHDRRQIEKASDGAGGKSGYFLCISETSMVKDEAAKFIDQFINSKEENEIMMAERGVPS